LIHESTAGLQASNMNKKNWSTQGERGNIFALKLIAWIAMHLGRRVSRWVLIPVVAYFFLSSPQARSASRKFLSKIHGQASGPLAVYRHLYVFAAVTLDRIYLLNGRLDLFDIQILDGNSKAFDTASSGIGMFLMGAHMGSFESVRSIARHHPALKMVLLMYEENAQNIKQLLKAINPDAQQDIIALGRPGAMLEVKEKLAQGALIGVLADRSFEDSGNTDVNFLGTKAALPLGPFRMAAMLRHPVYFMVGIYQGGRKYNIHIESIMDFSDPKIDREQAAQLAMARYVELLEKYCRLAPYNWFNFFDFWQENSNPS
jgi:predicted LPLAT superfamily acyltransferase